MIELIGDLFEMPKANDILCITTNGMIKKNGRAVMGAGIAKAALDRYPDIDSILATNIIRYGNHVHEIVKVNIPGTTDYFRLLNFPTKNDWRNDSSLALIERSSIELLNFVLEFNAPHVYMPRPGCSNGHLNWEEVKPILEQYFDDRLVVVSKY